MAPLRIIQNMFIEQIPCSLGFIIYDLNNIEYNSFLQNVNHKFDTLQVWKIFKQREVRLETGRMRTTYSLSSESAGHREIKSIK